MPDKHYELYKYEEENYFKRACYLDKLFKIF